jgi:molybdate transport system ATP-binding protein
MSLRARVASRLDGFELELEIEAEDGEVVAVVGPNGAGKTTLLRSLAGLIPLRDGSRVTLDGEVLDDPGAGRYVPTHRRPVGFVFQDLLLFDHMSVVDNVAFGLHSRGVARRVAHERAVEWLDRVGLADHRARKPRALSHGQKQRVALARALVTEPRLLLLDEPLASVDVESRVALREELRKYLAEVDGVRLLVTHDPADAAALADRVVALIDGHRREMS